MHFFEHVEGYISSKITLAREIMTLARLEAQLAGLNVVPLLLHASLLLALILSLWPTVLVLIGYLLFLLTHKLYVSILGVLLINLAGLFYLGKSSKKHLKTMRFERTRESLAYLKQKDANESTKETALELH
ncbi:MAG: hypothetical protein WC785_07260 [Tatlockia sp.]|jgi:hypothetical protein